MQKILSLFIFILLTCARPVQAQKTFQDGEWLKFRIHYGLFNASFATLEVKETTYNNETHFHVKGSGKSTGLLHAFFKVDDTYESYINKKTGLPSKFIRDINEGGYTKNKNIFFDQKNKSALVKDLKKNTEETYQTDLGVQDMISAFYAIRDQIGEKLKQEGDSLVINMFFDEKNYKFKTVYLGNRTIKTKFGKVETMELRPYVQSGRVFKEKESLTVYITTDENKVPVRVKAKLSVGSLTADLHEYKNLKHSFKIMVD